MYVKAVMKNEVSKIWLHYLGKRLYGKKDFESEVQRYGVQRSISFRILHNFSFGQPVLLAYYDKKHELAECIGYLTVQGLAHDLPFVSNLHKKLDIVNISNEKKKVNRRCGKYTVGTTAFVTNSLKEIIGFIKEVCEEHRLNPEKFKYFLTGSFTPFGSPVLINNMKFFRGYKKLEFEVERDRNNWIIYPTFIEYLKAVVPEHGRIEWIYDYKKRRYLTKKAREELEEFYK